MVTEQRRSQRLIVVSCVVLALALAGLLLPMPIKGRVANYIADLLHLPIFVTVTGVALSLSDLFVSRRLWVRLLTVSSVVVVSAGIEGLQSVLGRSASLQDLFANGCGALIALLIRQSLDVSRWTRTGLLAIAATIFAYAMVAPIMGLLDVREQSLAPERLAGFRSNAELRRWYIPSADVRIAEDYLACLQRRDNVLTVRVQPDEFPAVQLQHLTQNWTAYESLAFYLARPANEQGKLVVQLRVQAGQRGRRYPGAYLRRYNLQPGEQRCEQISLQEIAQGHDGNRVPLDKIMYVEFMAVELSGHAVFQLARLELVPPD